MFEWKGAGLSEKERIKQNVSNIIQLKKNDVRFDVDFGISPGYIDKPCSEAISKVVTEMIDVIAEREPRAMITPNDITLFIVNNAPTIQTATYPKFPIKFIIGCISPDKN